VNRLLLRVGCLAPALLLSLSVASAEDPIPPRPGPPVVPPGDELPSARGGAPVADPGAGERALDEAARWIAKGETPPNRMLTLHTSIDYNYDDGQTRDERQMVIWFRNPDSFRAQFTYAGRPSDFLLVGEQGFLIRDRIRVTQLNQSPTMKEVLPMLHNYREVLREVARLMVPAALKSPGAQFQLLGHVPNPRATGGAWYHVVRRAPNEPDMEFFFGTGQRRDGGGTRAIAPDKIRISVDPRAGYQGDEYRLENWSGQPNEQFRYPKRIRLYAVGLDPEEKPTMTASVNYLQVNVQPPPGLLDPP
jgi:hypothetical protein